MSLKSNILVLLLIISYHSLIYNLYILSHLCSYHLYISIYSHIFTISLISYPILNLSLHSLLSPYPVLYLHISPYPLSILVYPTYPLALLSTLLSPLYTLLHSILSYKEDIVRLLRIELRSKDGGL